MSGPSTPCPDEELVSAFVQGQLDSADRRDIEAHLDDCEACSKVVADLVRIFSVDAPRSFEHVSQPSDELSVTEGAGAATIHDSDFLPPGSSIGRYRTLECVGVGGMGVVYAAYDPELDRRVALKLLLRNAATGESGRRARLVREAQSLAKLTHANVITVHDVGTWRDQVFVAMEFVEGGTLKTWMREGPHDWPAVRLKMLAAGRGLVAAHAAGLVHRDFKPDNVLLGSDGRVRVTDFGLARWEDGAVSTGEQLISGASRDSVEALKTDPAMFVSPEVSLTRTGTLVGTPAYMAPEQYEQKLADAASDQYSFCVVLYEALYGRRPFKGETLAELATNVVSAGKVEFPSNVSVPRHVRTALRRGLSRIRSERFGSMQELLAVLQHRSARRWQLVAAGVLPAALLGAGVMAYQKGTPAEAEPTCSADGLSEVWGSSQRSAIAAAFAKTELAYADALAPRVLETLDAYADSWTSASVSGCEARQADGRVALAALQERCLQDRRIALEVVLGSLESVAPERVASSMNMVSSLPPAAACLDEQALLSDVPPPAPEAIEEQVEAVRRGLAKVEGHLLAAQYEQGTALARDLDAKAAALDHAPLRAETRVALGELLDRAGKVEEALALFEAAELDGTASRHHRVTAEALTHQVYLHGAFLEHTEVARRLVARARAEGEAGGLGDAFRTALLMNASTVEFHASDYEAAERLSKEALALRDREENPLRWADAVYNLAAIQVTRGALADGVSGLEQYLEVFESEVGRIHPEVAVGYHTLSYALRQMGRTEAAREALQTCLFIHEKTTGTEHPTYANPLTDLSRLEGGLGNYDEAIRLARQAMALRNRHGTEPLTAAENHLDIAEWIATKGDLEQGQAELTLAFAEARAVVEEGHPHLATFYALEASLAAYRKDLLAAKAASDQAATLYAKAFGDDHPNVWGTKVAWAENLEIAGERAKGIAELRALIPAMEGANAVQMLPDAQFKLAKMLHAEGAAAEEISALGAAAERGYVELARPADAASVARWLADRS
ncbi:MAG: protein kinase [Myxococcota bacterium]